LRSTFDEIEWSASSAGHLRPEKKCRNLLNRWLAVSQGWFGRFGEQILLLLLDEDSLGRRRRRWRKKKKTHRNLKIVITVKTKSLVSCLASQKWAVFEWGKLILSVQWS